MFVGCPATGSLFTLNNESFPNPNPTIQRQTGIVSLLGSDTNTTTNHHSIKRTLSADMSSPKWLENNGFSSPMKRAQSSDRLNVAVEEEDNLNNQISTNEDDQKKRAFEDIWSSILSQKGSGSGSGSAQLPPPYVHPMVKRTTSSLSEKSLEICTESLGSETGSDGFSIPVSSEPEDTDKDSETTEDQDVEHVHGSSNMGLTKDPLSPTPSLSPGLSSRMRSSSFPPPLPSLANRNGSHVHIMSHRQNGRLVLEVVDVPSQNCFKAQRHDGRLLLTLDDDDDDVESCKDHIELEEDVLEVDNDDELEDIDFCDKVDGSCLNSHMEMVSVKQASTPALTMSKFKWLSTTKPRNVNATINNDRSEVDQHKSLLPPRPKMSRVDGPVSTATTNSVLNGYEYYWRQTATAIAVLKPIARQQNLCAVSQVVEKKSNYMSKLLLEHSNGNSNIMGQDKQEVVVVKAIGTKTMKGDQMEKGEYLVPFLRGCKGPKRSLLLWEPNCIATS